MGLYNTADYTYIAKKAQFYLVHFIPLLQHFITSRIVTQLLTANFVRSVQKQKQNECL